MRGYPIFEVKKIPARPFAYYIVGKQVSDLRFEEQSLFYNEHKAKLFALQLNVLEALERVPVRRIKE